MKDKDLIKSISLAYDVKPSKEGKKFIREHQQRRIRLFDVIRMELSHLNWLCVLGLLILLSTSFLVCERLPKSAWAYGSLIPFFVLLSVISFGRSERYGMNEIESASRFSKTFIKMVRLFISGTFSAIALIICSLIMNYSLGINVSFILMLVIVPFLLNTYGSMVIIRRWHSKNNIYGCVALSVGCSLLPLLNNIKGLLASVPLWGALIIGMILVAATVKELIGYVRYESEEIAWN